MRGRRSVGWRLTAEPEASLRCSKSLISPFLHSKLRGELFFLYSHLR